MICPVCGTEFDETVSHTGVAILNKAWRTFCSRQCKSKKNNTPERQRKQRLKSKYGMTTAEYDQILASQGGGCAICGGGTDSKGRSLHVDHHHDTGKNRGILCTMCNPGVGYFRDDPELLEKAADYLRRHGG